MRVRKSTKKPDAVADQVIRWYRVHGNSCEFSVWKLIRLVNGSLGRSKIDAANVEIAKRYVSKIQHDLNVMGGMEKIK